MSSELAGGGFSPMQTVFIFMVKFTNFLFSCIWNFGHILKAFAITEVIVIHFICNALFFTFRSLIHLEFILVYGLRNGSNFVFFPHGYPVVPTPFIKKISTALDTTFIIY